MLLGYNCYTILKLEGGDFWTLMTFDYLHPDWPVSMFRLILGFADSIIMVLCNIKNVSDFALVQARLISKPLTIKRKEKVAS